MAQTTTWNANKDLIVGNDLWCYIVDLGHGESAVPMTYELATTSAAPIAYATSCSLEISAEQLQASSKMSCRWNVSRQGEGSWTVSCDALLCLQSSASANGAYTVDDLFEAMIQGDNVGVVLAKDSHTDCNSIGGPSTDNVIYWGEAAITSLSITGGNNEICSSSISLAGSGQPHKGNDVSS